MANDKEIIIRTKLDQTEFDRQIKQITQKLKGIESTEGGVKKDPILSDFAKKQLGDFSSQSQGQLQNLYNTQRQQAIQESITLKGKQQELQKIHSAEDQITKQTEQRVSLLKKEIDLLKEQHQQTLKNASEIQNLMDKNGVKSHQGGGSEAGGGGFDVGSMLNKVTKISAALGTAIYAADRMATSYRLMPTQMNAFTASSVQGTVGQGLSNLTTSGAFEKSLLYSQENLKAMQMARANTESTRRQDQLVTLGGGLAGMAGGAAAGGIAGSAVFPGIGTLAGGAIGGIAGAMTPFLDPRRRSFLLGGKEGYNNYLNKETTENYQQNLSANINKDAFKKEYMDYFYQNRQNLLGAGRSTQMGDKDLFSMMGAGSRVGISDQQMMQNFASLGQSGASTELLRGGGAMGTQAQRLGLGNAQEMMASISKLQPGKESTEQQFIKLLSEGVKIGLDSSKLPQETRLFADAVVKFAENNNIKDIGNLASNITQAMSGQQLSMANIQAGIGAEQSYQGMTSETGGARGFMGASSLMKSGIMKNVAPENQNALFSVIQSSSEQQLTQDTALNRDRADQMGLDWEEYKDKIHEAKAGGVVLGDKSRKMAKDITGKYGSFENVPEQVKARFANTAMFENYDQMSGDTVKDTATFNRMLQSQFEKPEGADTGLMSKRLQQGNLSDAQRLMGLESGGGEFVYAPGQREDDIASLQKRLTEAGGQIPNRAAEASITTEARGMGSILEGVSKEGSTLDAITKLKTTMNEMNSDNINRYVEANRSLMDEFNKNGDKAVEVMQKMGEALSKIAESGQKIDFSKMFETQSMFSVRPR